MCTVKRFGGQSPQKHLREEGVVAWESTGTRRRGEPCTGWGGLERARPCVLHLPEVSLQGERLPVRGARQAGRGRWGAPAGALSSQTGATPASSTQPSLAPPLQPRWVLRTAPPGREPVPPPRRVAAATPQPQGHARRASRALVRAAPEHHGCWEMPGRATLVRKRCRDVRGTLGEAVAGPAPRSRQRVAASGALGRCGAARACPGT